MKTSTLLAATLSLWTSTALAGDITPADDPLLDRSRWQAYLSYATPTEIAQQSEDSLWVLASGAIYLYEPGSQRVTCHSKLTGLSDTGIAHIAWNGETHQLLVAYENGNLDIVTATTATTPAASASGQEATLSVQNLNDLNTYTTSLDKTVNRITMSGHYAYLATGFGVLQIDLSTGLFGEMYRLGQAVYDVQLTDTDIWVLCSKGKAMYAPLTANLMNPSVWQQGNAPAGLLGQTPADWTAWHATVEQLNIDGPAHNCFAQMRYRHGHLLTVGGGYMPTTEMRRNATPQVYTPATGTWQVFQQPEDTVAKRQFVDMMDIDEDPLMPGHVFTGGRTGLFEWQDGVLEQHYTTMNSPLETVLKNHWDSLNYVLVETCLFDGQGNLWMLNSNTKDNNVLISLSAEHEWQVHSQTMPLCGYATAYTKAFIDSRQLLWVNDLHWSSPATFAIDISDSGDPSLVRHLNNRMKNQQQLEQMDLFRQALAEDSTGNVWIGTSNGIFMVTAEDVMNNNNEVTQPELGEGIVGQKEYLLKGQSITAIAVDAENHLWVGTGDQGIIQIDNDGLTILHHFTADNSPLLSSAVESLAYVPETGLLYIGTTLGLCSFDTGYTNGQDTGISTLNTAIDMNRPPYNQYYTLDGRLITGRPSAPGIYVHCGRKIVIR